MQATNWAKAGSGERYGKGEIYAFEALKDAIRWGAKMEWEFKSKKPEDISIVKIKKAGKWEVDKNDPLSQAGSAGQWLHTQDKVPAENIVSVTPLTRELIKNTLQK